MPAWVEQLLQDVRYTLRMIRRAPGFAGVVILTLAVAIGMNTAIFGVFNAVILRPLAYPHPDRLVWLSLVGPHGELVTGPDFADWRARATSFDRVVAYGQADFTLLSPKGAARVRAAQVTDDFWDLAGVTPSAGRLPRTDELDVVLLTHGFAQRSFAGDPDVIGRTITLDGRQVSIVGVLPRDFRFHFPATGWPGSRTRDVDLFQPMTVSSERTGMLQVLSVVGRLRPGVNRDTARAEIEAIRLQIAEAHPDPFHQAFTLRVVPLHDELLGSAGTALRVLLGAVAFVLLIACANAANLLLARASARHREVALRMAVGAGRGRLLRQMLVESIVLAGIGGAAGLFLANAGVAGLLRVASEAIPRLAETTLDPRVLVVAVGVSVGTALLSGLAPALALWKTDLHDALKSGVGASPSAANVRLRRVLVSTEIALALVLLAGAGLLLKGFWRMHETTPGFEPQRVLTARLEFSGATYSEPHRQIGFVDRLLERLRSEPGVEAAAISTHGYRLTGALLMEGEPVPAPEEVSRKTPITINSTTASMRQVMGLHIVRGRWFEDNEAAVVLNDSLARREFDVADPIGRRIRMSDDGPLLTIVGVVADLKYTKLDAPAEPELYLPYARADEGLFGFSALLLAKQDPLTLAPRLRQIVAEIDRTQVVDDVMTLEQLLADSVAPRRLQLFLLATFAVTALFLAAVGVYGVMSYAVALQVQEIGVRMALGAQRSDVVRTVARQGLSMTLAGVVVGLVAALSLTRFMESLLYEVQPADPVTFALVTAALGAIAIVACCVPAVRAALVDPATILRHD